MYVHVCDIYVYVCLTRNLVNKFQLHFDIIVVCSFVYVIFVSDGLFEIRCVCI